MRASSIETHADQLQVILNHLRAKRWCAVLAPRHAGKTAMSESLCRLIAHEHPTWKSCRVSFEAAGTMSAAWCQIIRGISGSEEGCSLLAQEQDNLLTISGIVTRTEHKLTCVILDQLNQLPEELLRTLAAELRRFFNSESFAEARNRVCFVLFGSDQLLQLASGPNSPLEGVVELIRLRDLSQLETEQLFCAFSGQHLMPDSALVLHQETGGFRHLVLELAKTFQNKPAPVESIHEEAEKWAQANAHPGEPIDDCFHASIYHLKTAFPVFRLVSNLLEGTSELALPTSNHSEVCALIRTTGTGAYEFRGRMFERACRLYFDDLRRGDFFALHGDWESAKDWYGKLDADKISQGRGIAIHADRNHLLDICFALLPTWTNSRDSDELAAHLSDMGRFLFGADRTFVWESTGNKEPLLKYPQGGGESDTEKATVSAAIRHSQPQVLSDYRGVIQPLGIDESKLKWALELIYEGGLPSGNWVQQNLKFAAPALSSALNQLSRRRRADLFQGELLQKAALAIQSADSVNEMLDTLVGGTRDILGYECAQISLLFETEGLIRPVASRGAYEKIGANVIREVSGNDILARVVRTGVHELIANCEDPKSHCDLAAIILSELKSQVVVPLKLPNGRCFGTLQVGSTTEYDAFTDSDARIVQLLADHAAIAIEIAKQRETLTLALEAAGDAMAVVDAQGKVRSCNQEYTELTGIGIGFSSAAWKSADPQGAAYQLAVRRESPVQNIREFQQRSYIINVAGRKDSFGRFVGGVEVIGSRSPMSRLLAVIGGMNKEEDEGKMANCMVRLITEQFGFKRARYYKASMDGRYLTPEAFAGCKIGKMRGKKLTKQFSLHVLSQGYPVLMSLHAPHDQIELGRECRDQDQRRVIYLDPTDAEYHDELCKTKTKEWMDIPLGTFAKLTVDHGESLQKITQEEIELMEFFSHLASESLTRVIELDRARRQEALFRNLGQTEGLEPLVREYLISITRRVGNAFNRAAFFIRQPQSANLVGFKCHGAPNGFEWGKEIDMRGDIEDLIPRRDDASRNQALRTIRILPEQSEDILAQAAKSPTPVLVTNAAVQLRDFYYSLEWQATDTCLLYPIRLQDSCEALLYVDYAFLEKKVAQEDAIGLNSTSGLLAAALRVHRRAERLNEQIRGLTHSGISPMAAAHGLAETLLPEVANDQKERMELIIAESQRATDTIRCVLRSVEYAANKRFLNFNPKPCEVIRLLRESTAAYRTLMKADGTLCELLLPSWPIMVEVDSMLLGIAFAELAANARMALQAQSIPLRDKFFKIEAKKAKGNILSICFSNAGVLENPRPSLEIFDPYVSGTGSTGLGLGLVRSIIQHHGGRISHSPFGQKPQFEITLPIRQS